MVEPGGTGIVDDAAGSGGILQLGLEGVGVVDNAAGCRYL